MVKFNMEICLYSGKPSYNIFDKLYVKIKNT